MVKISGLILLFVLILAGCQQAERPIHLAYADVRLALPTGETVAVEMLFSADASPDDIARAQDDVLSRFPGATLLEDAHEGFVRQAYEANSYRWVNGQATWYYNPSGKPAGLTGDEAAMWEGAQTWSNAGANFRFNYAGLTTRGTGGCNNDSDKVNTVGWALQENQILAITCTWYAGESTFETDIEFDPDWEWTTSRPIEVDLQSVAVHEFGHALGLGHSDVEGAVMWPSYMLTTAVHNLRPDDIQGVKALYGEAPATPSPTHTPPLTRTPSPTFTPTPPRTPSPTEVPTYVTPTETPPSPPPTYPGEDFPIALVVSFFAFVASLIGFIFFSRKS